MDADRIRRLRELEEAKRAASRRYIADRSQANAQASIDADRDYEAALFTAGPALLDAAERLAEVEAKARAVERARVGSEAFIIAMDSLRAELGHGMTASRCSPPCRWCLDAALLDGLEAAGAHPFGVGSAAADAARRTVGTPITECSNRLWLRAIDLAVPYFPRRTHESEDDHRGRLGKMIRGGGLSDPARWRAALGPAAGEQGR